MEPSNIEASQHPVGHEQETSQSPRQAISIACSGRLSLMYQSSIRKGGQESIQCDHYRQNHPHKREIISASRYENDPPDHSGKHH